ncbi:unnamed protein product [Paramecium octaurelia]|uniref:Uncharacterized protein n=1 Tax=Paramecium octaurelia TaxID=43137 RepID=A0A8S1TV98_PAROT|nr:unnamed protein product [Paramecium octaurelia]
MSSCLDEKITCELINVKAQDILNNLEQIAPNYDSTIILTIQQSYIKTYFCKNEEIKFLSSSKVTKDKYYSQIQYLTTSNTYIAIPQSQILISTLYGVNSRKFMQKVKHQFYSCQSLLLNKKENILFLTEFNQIEVFEKQIIGWKSIDLLQTLSNRDSICSLCLSPEEDYLVTSTSNYYSGSPAIVVYRKKVVDNQKYWMLTQGISSDSGELWGFVNNFQFLFLNFDSLQIYTENQQNKKFENTNTIQFEIPYFQCKSFAFLHQHQILLIITINSIYVMKLQEEKKLLLKQQIQINLSQLIKSNPASMQFNSILTKDGKYLFIWNGVKTQVMSLTNL